MSKTASGELPRVAVLLASRNGLPWLPAQVESIFAQVDVVVTLAVADDASTDATWVWLEETLGKRADVLLIRHDRPSGSAGANFRKLFIEADTAGADYVALADQDDLWAPDKLRRAIEQLSRFGAVGYSSAAEAFWADGRVQQLKQSPRVRTADFLFEGAGQGCTFVLDRRFFLKVREFCRSNADATESLHYHDWLIYLLSRAWNQLWVFDDRSAIRYRQHDSNEIGARRGIAAVEKRLKKIKSGWFKRQVAAASHLYLLAGGKDSQARAMAQHFIAEGSARTPLSSRTALALRLMRLGRRRSSDRIVLAIAALAGWL